MPLGGSMCVYLCKKYSKVWWLHRKDSTLSALQDAEVTLAAPWSVLVQGNTCQCYRVLHGLMRAGESIIKIVPQVPLSLYGIFLWGVQADAIPWHLCTELAGQESSTSGADESVQAPFCLCNRSKMSTWMRGRCCLQQGNWSRGRLLVDFSTVPNPPTAYLRIIPSPCHVLK